jgi:sigma-B regulation protein RsbU (phosphoserine phosphatase)
LPLTMILTHRKLRPISVITEHLRNTKPSNLSIDIPIQARNEFGYLADTLRVMGQKVIQAQLQTVERERMARELEIAREIQANILPKTFPKSSEFESFGFYQSAREVGGDYFDFIEIDSHRLGFLVADVSGKSLPGMLVMLLTRDIVKQASRQVSDPAQLLEYVNKELRPNIRRGMFVTMFFGVLDRLTGRIDFASAGHNPLLCISAADGDISQYKPKGYPLGLMAPEQFVERIEVHSLNLKPGDVLVQYSDGINEAHNRGGEEYGMDRFVSSIRQNSRKTAEKLVESVVHAHSEFVGSVAQYDDITLVAVKWHGHLTDNSNEENHAGNNGHQHQIA